MVTGFAASFSTVELLSQIKRFQPTSEIVSNEPLLAQTPGDVSNPVTRRIFGVPLYSVPESTDNLPTIPDGTVWAIAADKSFCVLRQDLSVMANPYSAFSSDSTQIRGVMRAGFGFTQPDCVVQIVHRLVRLRLLHRQAICAAG